MSDSELVRRHVARILLFDANDRLLLFFARDGVEPTNPPYWYLPGGGMVDGESPEQAARRELVEEAGVVTAEIGAVVARFRGIRFQFEGHDFEQDEWLVTGRLLDGRLGQGRVDDGESAAVAAHRWWSLDELNEVDAVMYPTRLPEMVTRLLRDGVPSEPWVFESN